MGSKDPQAGHSPRTRLKVGYAVLQTDIRVLICPQFEVAVPRCKGTVSGCTEMGFVKPTQGLPAGPAGQRGSTRALGC